MTVKRLLYILTIVLLASCQSEYQKTLKSNDYDAQYEAAIKLYESGDYFKAYGLFEKLMPVYRLTEKAERVNYLIAQSYYKENDFLMAAYYFNRYIVTFPTNDLVEDCYYYKALCYYNNSPKSTLDQTYTKDAIDAFQLYINKYSNGAFVAESNAYIAELREKLEKKAYDQAKLYYTLEDYKAAVVVLKNVLNDYPDTKYREEILFITFRSAYLLADKSIDSKKEERFEAAIEDYHSYIDEFPQGKWAKDAEKIFTQLGKKKEAFLAN